MHVKIYDSSIWIRLGFYLFLLLSHSVLVPCRALATPHPPLVVRVLDFALPEDVACFRDHFDGKFPAVIRNAFKIDNEEWTSNLMALNSDAAVEYDVRFAETGDIESYECTLEEFVGGLFEGSAHEESMYLMNEDLLNESEENGVLLNDLKLPRHIFGEDLFTHFPDKIRPKLALIIGGVGARSFLHGDPYEWMGWNYLFEGEKLWTFIPPVAPDALFESRRNAPDAWGTEYAISAGWVSDEVDLYRRVVPKSAGKKQTVLNGFNRLFASQKPVCSSVSSPTQLPVFVSGNKEVDSCGLPLIEGSLQVVQREGDLVMIPPRWWHQVYHLQPSIAVASQYVNDLTREQMFRHVLDWCAQDADATNQRDTLAIDDFKGLDVREQVHKLILQALVLKNGQKDGQEKFSSLFDTCTSSSS